jgi:hypothetical protein
MEAVEVCPRGWGAIAKLPKNCNNADTEALAQRAARMLPANG